MDARIKYITAINENTYLNTFTVINEEIIP